MQQNARSVSSSLSSNQEERSPQSGQHASTAAEQRAAEWNKLIESLVSDEEKSSVSALKNNLVQLRQQLQPAVAVR